MPVEQWIIFGTLLLTMVLFVSGRWRYDVVALIALLIVTLTGLVPVDQTFSGFSNPAVITVAAVLVLSRSLQNSGIVDWIGQQLEHVEGGTTVQMAVLTGIVALLSAFMNNVGALALLLPVAMQLARKKQLSPSTLMMPLAFASLLGGMTTLIGTPSNIIVSSIREQTGAPPFGMFDFAPVGFSAVVVGLLYIVFFGWRLIPRRDTKSSSRNLFDIENYITEVRLPADSPLNGKQLREISIFSKADVNIIGLVRNGERRMEPSALNKLRSNDILMVNADAENIQRLVSNHDLELVGSEKIERADLESQEITLIEAVIMPNSLMSGGTARSLNLRSYYGVNLLAIARQNKVLRNRLDRIRFRSGDVLLLQSPQTTAKEVMETLGCLPLAGRGLRLAKSNLLISLGIFTGAVLLSVSGLLPVHISFAAAVVMMVLTKIISLNEAYESVDWPVIILLGAMIPVGQALETTGGAQLIANGLLHISNHISPPVMLTITLIATLSLSAIINNAAAVVLMAPIGLNVAQGMSVSADPFLIAIAIGASCAFLTPISHQSNILVMGPGGYKFGDYWRMGLLLALIIVAVTVPLILFFWPL